VFDDKTVYGFARKPQYYRWTTPVEYHLFAMDKEPQLVKVPGDSSGYQRRLEKCQTPQVHPVFRWTGTLPILVRAMVLAGKTLAVAGPPDVVDEEDAYQHITDPAIRMKLLSQEESLAGRHGGRLYLLSADDGSVLSQCDLQSPPQFDGLAAAGRRLYLTTLDGSVVCFAGQ